MENPEERSNAQQHQEVEDDAQGGEEGEEEEEGCDAAQENPFAATLAQQPNFIVQMYAAAMQQNPGALMMMMPYMMQTMQQGMQGLQQQQDGTPTPGAPAAAAFPGYPQMTLAAEVTEEQPTYVNAKQYRRIIKRRQARAKLEERKKIPANRKSFLHKSRHEHACRRVRGPGGRFLTKVELEEMRKNGELPDGDGESDTSPSGGPESANGGRSGCGGDSSSSGGRSGSGGGGGGGDGGGSSGNGGGNSSGNGGDGGSAGGGASSYETGCAKGGRGSDDSVMYSTLAPRQGGAANGDLGYRPQGSVVPLHLLYAAGMSNGRHAIGGDGGAAANGVNGAAAGGDAAASAGSDQNYGMPPNAFLGGELGRLPGLSRAAPGNEERAAVNVGDMNKEAQV